MNCISHILFIFKMIFNLLLLTILQTIFGIPQIDQINLANSLEVGNNNDPNDWTCPVCDASNKPTRAH